MKKYYDTLGLKNGASQEEIQAAYEKLSNELNPNKNNNEAFFVEEYKKVQEAYEALSHSSILATEKGAKEQKGLGSDTKLLGPSKNEKTNSKKEKKRLFKKENIVLFLLVLVSFQCLHLQLKLLEVSNTAQKASSYAKDAYDAAEWAQRHAQDASSYAEDAYNAAFANQCRYCP